MTKTMKFMVLLLLGLVLLLGGALVLNWNLIANGCEQDFHIELLENETCSVDLCRSRGTLQYCFGLQVTNCTTLKEKCIFDEEMNNTYMGQWNMKCRNFS